MMTSVFRRNADDAERQKLFIVDKFSVRTGFILCDDTSRSLSFSGMHKQRRAPSSGCEKMDFRKTRFLAEYSSVVAVGWRSRYRAPVDDNESTVGSPIIVSFE